MDRRRTPARSDLAADHLRGRVEAARYVVARPMQVAAECLDLLRAPQEAAPRDTQALHGERLDVYEILGPWAWVQLAADGYVGYLRADGLRTPTASSSHRVAATRTFVYEAPSIKSRVMLALPMTAAVAAAGEAGPFVESASGGFIFANHLARAESIESDFVAVAERFLAAPYLWGGKTWLGVDCSGLLQIALRSAGVDAPRDTDMQEAELGEPVDPAGPFRRGDLLFWKGHVGLMQDGERLLHANGHHMAVASEPLAEARRRIVRAGGGEVTSAKRLG